MGGHIISKKSFSYNKRSILLNYRDIVLRNRLRIKTKFKYFRRGFLKNLNYTLFLFKFFRKSIRIFSFIKRKNFSVPSSLGSIVFKRKRAAFFKSSKTASLLKFNLLYTNSTSLDRFHTKVYNVVVFIQIFTIKLDCFNFLIFLLTKN